MSPQVWGTREGFPKPLRRIVVADVPNDGSVGFRLVCASALVAAVTACGGPVVEPVPDSLTGTCLTAETCVVSPNLSTAGFAQLEASCKGTMPNECPTANAWGTCTNVSETVTVYVAAGGSGASWQAWCDTTMHGTWTSS